VWKVGFSALRRREWPPYRPAIMNPRCLLLAIPFAVAGCTNAVEIGGAYFPAWLICSIAGLCGASMAHAAMARSGFGRFIEPRRLAFPSIGVLIALFVYLLFFRS